MTAVRQGVIWSLDFIEDILAVSDDGNPAKGDSISAGNSAVYALGFVCDHGCGSAAEPSNGYSKEEREKQNDKSAAGWPVFSAAGELGVSFAGHCHGTRCFCSVDRFQGTLLSRSMSDSAP
jgi:hypothetical protein